MTKKQIHFTFGQGDSYIIQLESKGYNEKLEKIKKGEPSGDVSLEDFHMFKLVDENKHVAAMDDGAIQKIFGTSDENAIMEYMIKQTNLEPNV